MLIGYRSRFVYMSSVLTYKLWTCDCSVTKYENGNNLVKGLA